MVLLTSNDATSAQLSHLLPSGLFHNCVTKKKVGFFSQN